MREKEYQSSGCRTSRASPLLLEWMLMEALCFLSRVYRMLRSMLCLVLRKMLENEKLLRSLLQTSRERWDGSP